MTRPRLALALLAADLALAPAAARAHLSQETAAINLSQEPAPPSPSERDLAYELGVQAEASGDHARAAAAHERAYRLTPAVETGPRLLFLRASVAARLRADDGSEPTRVHLCHAQVLLRDYLADPALAPEPRSAERSSLGRVEQRLATTGTPANTCDALLGLTPAPPAITPPPTTTAPPQPIAPIVEGPAPPPAPAAPLTRPLRISGGVSLGLGVTGLALLAAGIAVARGANRRGLAYCSEAPTACVANDSELRAIETAGLRGDSLIRVGVVMAGLGILAGVTLLALSARKPGPRRINLAPHGLAARF